MEDKYKKHELEIIELLRLELSRQRKSPAYLTENNNPNSTLKKGKLFALFGENPPRLAFVDFLQICDLLHITPQTLLTKVLKNTNTNDTDTNVRNDENSEPTYTINEIITQLQNEIQNQKLKKIYSITQIIQKIGISAPTFYQNFKPYIPHIQIGGKAYYTLEDVQEFIESNKVDKPNKNTQ